MYNANTFIVQTFSSGLLGSVSKRFDLTLLGSSFQNLLAKIHVCLHIFPYRMASEPELNTLCCSMCRRELGVWNFFPLTHDPTEQDDRQGQDAPPYLDTGQMFDRERRSVQIPDPEGSCSGGSSEDDNQEVARDDGGNTGPKAEKSEPMEEGGGCDRADKSSTEDSAMEKEYQESETSITLNVKSFEPMGLKSPLHRSLSNLPGEETTESLCVEVENESLSERLQDVESELEFMGCGREGMLERGDGGPRAKKRRLQVQPRSGK